MAGEGTTVRPEKIYPQGEGSMLNADKLDGKHAAYFLDEIEKLKKRVADLEAKQ